MSQDEKISRAVVFIDGNNLYHRLKDSNWKTWIDVGSLAQRVAGQRELRRIYYYNAPPPGGKSHTQKGNEYLAQVKAVPNLVFRLARLQYAKRSDEHGEYQSYVEKNADTALTADLISEAASDGFDVAIIISNDGDYEHAARMVRDTFQKTVEVIYFEGSRPFAMEKCALMRRFRRGYLKEMDYLR